MIPSPGVSWRGQARPDHLRATGSAHSSTRSFITSFLRGNHGQGQHTAVKQKNKNINREGKIDQLDLIKSLFRVA